MKRNDREILKDLHRVSLGGKQLCVPERLRFLFEPIKQDGAPLDVSSLFPHADPRNCIIHFNNLPTNVSMAAQLFARMEVFFNSAPATVQGHLNYLRFIFTEAEAKYGVSDYRLFTFEQFQQILNVNHCSADKISKCCASLMFLYETLGSFAGQKVYLMELEKVEALKKNNYILTNATKNVSKTPSIDDTYFETLGHKLNKIINDDKAPINFRMTAALLNLGMHCGLRPSELVSLTTKSRITKTGPRGMKVDFLLYSVPKLSHGGRYERNDECYMLPGAIKAYEDLLRLRALVPGHEDSNVLYFLEKKGPSTTRAYKYYTEIIFIRYLQGLGHDSEIKLHKSGGKTFRMPNQTQFRVHLCSYLYAMGVDMAIIELGMSHLTIDMLAYYARAKDRTFESYQNRADNIILAVAGNDYDLEDHSNKGHELLLQLPLSIAQVTVYTHRLEEMKAKGDKYKYDADRYKKQIQNKIMTEIEPAQVFLNALIKKIGKENVYRRYPLLKNYEENDINALVTKWQRTHMK